MKGKAVVIRWIVLLVVAAAVYWKRNDLPLPRGQEKGPAPVVKTTPVLPSGSASQKVRGYDKFTDARLVGDEGNDGDSFLVRAGGKEFVLRLYFVDTPEKYLSDRYENQRRRVEEQAREMGRISVDEAIAVGLAAKKYTESQIKGKTFTVYTYWEEVYDGDRYYGFVELPDGSYLGTRLVEQGLARIHTKGPGSKEHPVPTPDGKSFHQHRDMLYGRERAAQKAGNGAWGL